MEDWTEKYRPSKLDDIVGNKNAIVQIQKWANSWLKGVPKKKALILSGKAGIGKTSAVIALANDYKWTLIELNTSDARNAKKIQKVATFGAVNETFDDNGQFITSKNGGRKLIMLDEADNLYEKTSKNSTTNEDLSDRGGKKAIIDTIKQTNQPIILIVNDYYSLIKGSGEILKTLCIHIKFYTPYPNNIISLLKKISLNEGINVDPRVLQNIANRCKGDIRSAVNDLQSISFNKENIDVKSLDVIGYRDREKDIFSALNEIFKTKNLNNLKENLRNLNEDPNLMMLWINENLPKEYKDNNDLSDGYLALSKADVFLGRTYRRQNFRLWAYACDMMNGGVATAKTHNYPNSRYNFPTWLKDKKTSKNNRDIRESIATKIGTLCHNSKRKSKQEFINHFSKLFRNNMLFAIKMKNKLDLNEAEIRYLLGKKHENKLKEIMKSSDKDNLILYEEKQKINDKKEELNVEKEDKEKTQQSLFDF